MGRLTVIGAGGTGHAMAAYYTACGHEVCFCDTDSYGKYFADIRANGGIDLRGNSGKTGLYMPAVVTSDFAEAMAFCNRVFICASATRHEEIAKLCAPHVTANHIICISNGNLGSPIFKRVFAEAGAPEGCVVAELAGNLGSCRLLEGAVAVIALPMGGKKVAAYPACDTQKVIDAFADVIALTPAANIFEGALNCPNVVIHLAGSLMNATSVERMGKEFCFFTHGVSEAVQNVIAAIEAERDAMFRVLGFKTYDSHAEFIGEIRDVVGHPELNEFRTLDGPDSMKHRYITEDAIAGVSLMLSLGEEYGIPMPVQGGMMAIACAVNGENYYAKGRTLENLGLKGLTVDALTRKLLGN